MWVAASELIQFILSNTVQPMTLHVDSMPYKMSGFFLALRLAI